MGQSVSLKSGGKPPLDTFVDLRTLPPEVAVSILANLNATDLCLAGCVWQDLAASEMLWKKLCLDRWQYLPVSCLPSQSSFFVDPRFKKNRLSYRELYLLLDEAMLILRKSPDQGIEYLKQNNIMDGNVEEMAKFINNTNEQLLPNYQKLLGERSDIVLMLIELQDYRDQRLSDALRRFFKIIHPSKDKDHMDNLLALFATRYHQCNQHGDLTKDATGVLSYSLLLLSVDLYSPHVKNKMSKREFIRNNRRALPDVPADLLGDLYDDIYVNGHVAVSCPNMAMCKSKPLMRPYGVIFELQSWRVQLCC